jgi:hypothetical protein
MCIRGTVVLCRLVLWIYIQKVSGSNLNRNIDYSDWGALQFSSGLSHGCLHPDLFKFIIHHWTYRWRHEMTYRKSIIWSVTILAASYRNVLPLSSGAQASRKLNQTTRRHVASAEGRMHTYPSLSRSETATRHYSPADRTVTSSVGSVGVHAVLLPRFELSTSRIRYRYASLLGLFGVGSGLSTHEDETSTLLSDLEKVIVPCFNIRFPVIYQERRRETKQVDSGSPVCSVTYKNRPKKGMHVK